jgi:hypothetical protein
MWPGQVRHASRKKIKLWARKKKVLSEKIVFYGLYEEYCSD